MPTSASIPTPQRRAAGMALARRGALALSFALALAGCRSTADMAAAGASHPTAPDVALPARVEAELLALSAPPDDWTALVGRRVRIDAPLTLSGRNDRPAPSLVASFDGRLFTPTEIAPPGSAADAVARGNARRTLRLLPAPPLVAIAPDLRVGSVLTGVTGEVVADDGVVALRLSAPPAIAPAPRPPPPSVPGDVRLASFNLENLFNGDGRGGGFPTPRGARTPAEFDAQLGRLVATITALQPDIAALMELENDGDGPTSAIATLVDALNAATPADPRRPGARGDWRAVRSNGLAGSDQIRVGIVYRASRVSAVGAAASLIDGPFRRGSRPPLAQAFRAGRGPVFVVVANHFKSKGCGEADGANRDLGDGQACWNAARVDAARRLDAWLKTDPTRTRSDLTAILGDLNAYAMEDPLRLLRDAGWRDALAASTMPAQGPAPPGTTADADVPYSYVFRAQSGRLDHALLSPTLAARLGGAAEWHSNADEADNVGDRGANAAASPAAPWRSSDHDPLLVGLQLRDPGGKR